MKVVLRQFSVLFLFGILFVSLLPQSASAAILGRWKLDEGTGSTATDSSDNGRNGTWSGTSSGNTGYYDTNATSSLSYSGSFSSGDDQVLITGITTVTKSVTFWAYIPNLDGTTEMVSKSSSGQGFEVIINGGTIQFYTMGSDVIAASASSANINLNAWNHVVATYNGGGTTMRVYINGALSGSTGTAPATVNNVENLYFGTWGSGGRQFVGKLNDVRLYDVELNATQVSNVKAGSVDPDTPPDTTAPTVGLSAPASGASIGGSAVTLTATSTDSVGVSGVKFYYDTSNLIGSEITATSSANTYTTTFNTTGLSEGSHTLIAVARDAAGNRATSTAVSVTVDNTAPTISSVATSSITSSGATVTWSTNESASTKAIYSVDTNYASTTTETDTSTRVASHSKALSSLLSCTLYNFKTVSRDAAGNSATSSASSFTTSGCAGSASPSSSTSTPVTVSSAATTTLSDDSRSLRVVTPANFTATSSTIVIQIKGLDSSTVLSSIGKPNSSLSSAASIAFDVKALINNVTELDSFATAVTVTYTYTDADVSGLTESSLTMYHYYSSTWTVLDSCAVDTAANTITCTAPHFSVFAIFGTAPSTSGAARTPWKPSVPVIYHSSQSTECLQNDEKTYASCTLLPESPAVSRVLTVAQKPASTCQMYTFTRTLRRGMVGEDVRALQKLMNCLGFTIAINGPGSPSKETTRFADRTVGAVKKFQEAYATEILSPLRLTVGTGIFASLSQQKVRALVSE